MAPADVIGRARDWKEGMMQIVMMTKSCGLVACLCFCAQESFDLRAIQRLSGEHQATQRSPPIQRGKRLLPPSQTLNYFSTLVHSTTLVHWKNKKIRCACFWSATWAHHRLSYSRSNRWSRVSGKARVVCGTHMEVHLDGWGDGDGMAYPPHPHSNSISHFSRLNINAFLSLSLSFFHVSYRRIEWRSGCEYCPCETLLRVAWNGVAFTCDTRVRKCGKLIWLSLYGAGNVEESWRDFRSGQKGPLREFRGLVESTPAHLISPLESVVYLSSMTWFRW